MGLYTCPPKVRNLIDLINACGDQEMAIISVNEPDEFAAIAKKLSKVTAKFEPIARDYVWKGSIPFQDGSRLFRDCDTEIEDAIRRYDTLRRGRMMLERIVNISSRKQGKQISITTSSEVVLDELRIKESGKYRTVGNEVKYQDVIRIIKHPNPLDVLDGCPARIRKCATATCGKFFWAGRDTKTGCSERCNDAIRAARYRAKKKG